MNQPFQRGIRANFMQRTERNQQLMAEHIHRQQAAGFYGKAKRTPIGNISAAVRQQLERDRKIRNLGPQRKG